MNENLKKARLGMNMTQKEVAAKVGVTERNYQNYESETSQPKVKTALRIAKVLKKSVENLWRS